MAIIKPGQLSSGLYSISGSFSGSFQGDGSGLTDLPIPILETGSFVLTSSFNAFTSSIYSFTSSISSSVDSLTNATSSYVLNSQTSSMFVSSSIHADSASIAISSSYADNAISASYALTSSYLTSLEQQIILSGSLKLDPTQDPDPTGIDLDSTVLFQSSSNTALGYDLYIRQNGNLVKWKWIEDILETGLLYGGVVTYSGSNVFVSPGSGIISEHNATTGSEVSPIVEYVTWNAITQSITNIATQQVTYIYIDNTGTLQQQSTRFTSQQYHDYIPLGAVGHFDYTQVSAFGGGVQTAYDQISQISNFIDAFGPLKMSGYGLTGQVGSLRLSVGSGTSFIHGGFYQNDPEFPSQITTPSQATASLARVQRSGSVIEFDTNNGNFYTVVDPTQYDRDGDGVLHSVGSGNWSIQRVFVDPKTGVLYVYYGQARYTSLLNALQYLPTDPFTEGDTFDFTTFIGFLVLKGNASNITDTAANSIINGGLFRGSGQGSGGGIALSNLDDLTDVSIVSPTNGQALIYDNAIWKNGTPILATTASYVLNAVSASYATTASYASNSLSASYAPTIGPNLGQILFVSTTGNNTTAQIGDISKTYLTIESAVSASISGDVIHVFQGTYTLTTTSSAGIAKDGINYYFEPGCNINKATSGSIFNITGFTTGFNVFGYGTFNKTATVGTILTSVTNAFDFSFEALDISSTIDKCFNLSLNAKTATIKFRHAISSAGTVFTFPGVYFNGDNYDITATSITSTSTNAIAFSQGIGRINLKADLVKSTTSIAISTVYYTTANFNINHCLGVTYGYYIFAGSIATITGYTTGINNATNQYTTFNGTAGNLLNTSGTFTGGLILTPTINGGAATFTWAADYLNTLTVSAGIAYVTAAHNNAYSAPVNVTGGKLYLTGNINGGVNGNYSTFTINGATAELIFNGNYMFASGNKYQTPVYAFHLINGILRLTGNVENKIVNSSLATCVLYQSGSLILDGVSLRTINSEVPPIIVSTGARNLRTYSGGMSTNRIENGGTYAAKTKKYKYTVTAVASTSITLNDGSGGNEVFTESNTAVYNTTALLAQRMAVLINASATLDITATQDTPGTNTYFYTTADVAGIPFTTPAYTNLTELGIRENSYLMTELIGGTIIENSNII